MRIGCCQGVSNIEVVQQAGFDYIEGSVAKDLKPLESQEEFEKTLLAASGAGIKAEAFNIFIPKELPVTGTEVDADALKKYVETAMHRGSEIGAEIIVFGSGGARSVPEGFPKDRAMEQLREFLRMTGPIADKYGIKIAVEPLRPAESNIINTVAEGDALSRSAECEGVGVLADLYHVADTGESLDGIVKAGSNLIHVHTAEPVSREAPKRGTTRHREFFRALKKAGFDGRASVECNWQDLVEEGPSVVAFLREEWEEA